MQKSKQMDVFVVFSDEGINRCITKCVLWSELSLVVRNFLIAESPVIIYFLIVI